MNLLEIWPAVVFGWPSALGGLSLLALGIAFRQPWISALGALFSVGLCVYVSMNPLPFRIIGPLVLASNVASAVVLKKKGRLAAGVLLLPFSLFLAYMVYAIRSS